MKRSLIGFTLAALLAGCGDNDNNSDSDDMDDSMMPEPMVYEYQVTIENYTASQPFSPAAVVLHDASTQLWQIGEAASVELEYIAEAGDNTSLVASLTDTPNALGAGMIMPGESEVITVTSTEQMLPHFTTLTMLVNTNDAFTGVNSASIEMLEVDQSLSWYLPVYDAGTESNSESQASIPGPAAGGAGFVR